MNGRVEFRDAGKDAVAQPLGGDVSEDPFHLVQPVGRDRCEMGWNRGVYKAILMTLGCIWVA